MIAIPLFLLAAKHYFDLAKAYKKGKWNWAISAILVYYVGAFLGAFAIAIAIRILEKPDLLTEQQLNWASIPFGVLSCYICYRLLSQKWAREWREMH